MDEKSLKPQLRFKEFTDAWEQRKFQDMFSFERPDPYIVKSDKYSNEYTMPVLTANKAFVLGYTKENSPCKKTSLIFDDFTLECKYVDFPYMVKSSAIKILTVKDEKKDNLRFSFERLNTTKIEILGHARHYISVVQPTKTRTPNILEQNKISELFSNLDNLITLHQRKLDKLSNVKKALLEKMFPKNDSDVPEIRFKGFTDAWEQRKFDEVISRIATGLNPRDNFKLNSGGTNYYVTIKNFEHGHLHLDENCDKIDDTALKQIQERSDLQKDDILFSSIGRVGDCYLIESKPKNWNINESVFTLRPNKAAVNPLYMFHTIHADCVLSYILNNVTGSTFKSIKISDLKKAIIPLPNKEEQKKLGIFLSKLDNLITLHQRKLEKLKNIKKACLEKMFV